MCSYFSSKNGILRLSLPFNDVEDNITVTVYATGTFGRTGSYTQVIVLSAGDPPKVEIR